MGQAFEAACTAAWILEGRICGERTFRRRSFSGAGSQRNKRARSGQGCNKGGVNAG